MSKRNYTHIKELVPTIQVMVAEGMTQREIAEHFGFKDKSAVKFALLRARKIGTTISKFRGRKPAKTRSSAERLARILQRLDGQLHFEIPMLQQWLSDPA